jgi:VIT1/CCC1 family predicted Fe2+/Mn2+ transporter
MGASNYLGLKSELEQTGGDVVQEAPWRHGLATTAAFVVIGAVPLLAYGMPRPAGASVLLMAAVLSLVVLAGTGAARALFVGRRPLRSAAEMTAVGALAGAAAYAVGVIGNRLVAG